MNCPKAPDTPKSSRAIRRPASLHSALRIPGHKFLHSASYLKVLGVKHPGKMEQLLNVRTDKDLQSVVRTVAMCLEVERKFPQCEQTAD